MPITAGLAHRDPRVMSAIPIRAGADGMAASFCNSAGCGYLQASERLIQRRLAVIGEEPAAMAPDIQSGAKKPRGRPPAKSWQALKQSPPQAGCWIDASVPGLL